MTPKQQRFVAEYLIDLNATQAAIRAGYSKNRADAMGHENLGKPEIAKAVQDAMQARSQRTGITQDRVLEELGKIAFSDIRKAIKWGSSIPVTNEETGETTLTHGIALLASDQIDGDMAAAIAEVSESKQGLKVKLHDKRAALVDVGRHLGMFKDKVEITGKDGAPLRPMAELSTEEIRAAIEIIARAPGG
jgi:phage terminase small subunit